MTATRQDTQTPAAARAAARLETLQGIGLITLAIALLSAMDTLVKWLSSDYSTIQIMFFRSVFAFLPLAPLVLRAGWAGSLHTRRLGSHVLRSFFGLSAVGCFFWSLALLPLADATAITFAAPLFVTALSLPLLGEVVRARRWTAVGVGFLGVLVMVQPGIGVFQPAALLPLAAALFLALMVIHVRKLTRTESDTTIVLYYTIVSTLVTGAVVPFYWVTPDLTDFLLLAMVGVLGGTGHLALTAAYRRAEASILAPFDYTAMVWAVLFGFLLWGDLPARNIWLGCVIVIASGIYIIYREAELSLPGGLGRWRRR
ncbi:MAG: DMT family transporter [Kiloniellales bacterium]|nr:DMT family transporter [Kiloniellales bacterium]